MNTLVTKLAETAIMVNVKVHGWSGNISDQEWKRKLSDSMGVDENIFGIYGKGVPKEIKRRLETKSRNVKEVILLNSQPFMEGGWRIMPVRVYPKVQELFNKAVTALQEEVQSINREELVDYCKALYGKNYKEKYVPSEEELRNKFRVSLKTSQINLGTHNGNFEGLDKETSEKIRQETENMIVESYTGVIRGLIEGIQEVLKNFKNNVKEGKKKVSVQRTVTNITESLKDLLRFNLVRDPELEETVQRVYQIGLDMLKEKDDKGSVTEKASKVQEILNSIQF